MREDMAKVIVERPRIMDGWARKGRRVEYEDMPSRIGMRRQHREKGSYKMLNENLAPLRRFLEKQVGRPWNKVFSEICERLRVDSTVQNHVRDHVGDFVELDPQFLWHTVYLPDGTKERRVHRSHRYLYVDPVDGILKRGKKKESYRARERRLRDSRPVEKVVLSKASELHLIDGIWYAVEFATPPAPQYVTRIETKKLRLKPYDSGSPVIEMEVPVRHLVSAPVYDVLMGCHVMVGPRIDDPESRREWARKTHPGRYATSKRQLSGKELRHRGLVNGAPEDLPPGNPVSRPWLPLVRN